MAHYLSVQCTNDMDTILLSTHGNICVCCFSENGQFVNLTTCQHFSFFIFFFDNKNFRTDYQNSAICYQCHHFLKKIEAFKTQVEETFKILDGKSFITKPKKLQNLQISETKATSITEEESQVEVKIELESTINTISAQDHCDLITDVKIENENCSDIGNVTCSDIENDVPLSEIKKEIRIKKVVTKKKKRGRPKKAESKKKNVSDARSSRREKYEGKIAIVYLTKEEMMSEREADAKKESYLKLPYKCESCITGFDHELTLEDHMRKRHEERKGCFVCEICKSVLGTFTSYKEHTKRHSRRYECVECGRRNNNIYSVVKHYNDKHGCIETEFACQDCGFTTLSHRTYRYHRDKHKQKQQCSVCGSTFVNNAGLRVHMFTVHKQSSRVYSCPACDKVYAAKSGLAAHALSAHAASGARGAWCALCRAHFRTKYNLHHHLRTHSSHLEPGDRKFACSTCSSRFLTNTALQEHVDFVHLKTNKHECPKCSAVFKNSSALKKHDNFVHKKLRPPRNKICDHCGRGFTTSAILQAHIRTHTGERPLHCSRCPATFAHSAALYTHTKLLHSAKT